MTMNLSKKIKRKQIRCRAIVSNELNIPVSDEPTRFIGICNAGLSTGLTEDAVIQETQKHGQVSKLIMIPNKSYCFLGFENIQEASNIFQSMHGKAELGQNSTVIYMSYFQDIPESPNPLDKEFPSGLILIDDFVTEDEETLLLASISATPVDGSLKNRSVKHFGYEFLYGSNLVDPQKPLDTKIPHECDILWQKLAKNQPSLSWFVPDQLTVNQYMPGHGIPPHVDTHSAFLDPIFSLSLESDVVMDFRKNGQRVSVLLPQRSLLIMSGEARYDWTHGITPRIMDVVKTPSNNLTTQLRKKRTSFTFRKLRTGPCDCIYPTLCNSRQSSPKINQPLENLASKVEEMNVHSVYEKIANHFSETRHSPWPNVALFLDSFPLGSMIVDIGCGNGKYLGINKNTLQIGCDRSSGLLNVCTSNKQHVFKCDCLSVPIRPSSADGVISIAVIHHLASETRRLQSINEMARILRTEGLGLIYVWAKNQKANSKKSSYLRQNKAVNKGKTSEAEQRQKTHNELETQMNLVDHDLQLPIHTNRTEFLEQDVLVPWKLKSQQENIEKSTFLRFYHVFEENELENLCKKVDNIEIVKSFYDQGNHCVIFKKL